MASNNFPPIIIETNETFLNCTGWIVLFNSLFYFLIAHALIFILTSISSVVIASLFGISTFICKDQLSFLVCSGNWSRDTVILLFGTGPCISLLVASWLLIVFGYNADCKGSFRILITWMIILCLSNFFGGVIVGAILNTDLGYVFMYLYIMDTGRMIITIICMFLLFVIGRLLTRLFLFTANVYHKDLRGGDKLRFGMLQFMIPFILGNIIIGVYDFPSINLHNMCLRISTLLILVPILTGCDSTPDLFFYEEPRLPSLAISPAFIALLLLLIDRFVLGEGIIL